MTIRQPKRAFFLLIPTLLSAAPAHAGSVTQNFNRDWRFAKGEQTGAARQTGFNDSWQPVAPAVHFAHWGVFVPTPSVADGRATVRIQSSIDNYAEAQRDVTVEVTLLDPNGRPAANGAKSGAAPACGSVTVDQQMFVAKPQR